MATVFYIILKLKNSVGHVGKLYFGVNFSLPSLSAWPSPGLHLSFLLDWVTSKEGERERERERERKRERERARVDTFDF